MIIAFLLGVLVGVVVMGLTAQKVVASDPKPLRPRSDDTPMPLDGADAQALEHALTHAENDPRAHDTAADLVRATSTWKTT